MCIEVGRRKWMLNYPQSLDEAEEEVLQARKMAKRTLCRFATTYPSIKWRLACEVLKVACCWFILWQESQRDLQQLKYPSLAEWPPTEQVTEQIKRREEVELLLLERLCSELKQIGFEFEFNE
jgi:hypothetical protein